MDILILLNFVFILTFILLLENLDFFSLKWDSYTGVLNSAIKRKLLKEYTDAFNVNIHEEP